MQDPRSVRTIGWTAVGVLAAAVLGHGCAGEPKKPEPPAKTSPPMTAKGDTSTAKPGTPAKTTEVAAAKKEEPKAPPPAPKVEPKPEAKAPPPPPPAPKVESKTPPAPPAAKQPEPAAPVAKGGDEMPPKPPVNVPPPPPRNEPAETEAPPAEVAVPAETAQPGEVPTTGLAPAVKTPEQLKLSADETLLKSLAEEKRLELAKRKYLSEEYTARGEEAYKALKYEEAKEWATKALDEDSGNARAQQLLLKSRSALGERTGDVGDLTRELAETRRVKMEMNKEKAEALLAAGNAAMAKNNPEGAIRAYEDCLTIVRDNPYDISWGDLPKQAQDGLAKARASRERATDETRRKAAAEAYTKVKREELARLQQEKQKFDTLMADAIAAYDRDDFATAEDLATQALDLQPTSSRARSLKEAAARGRHGQTAEATRQRQKEEFRRWRLEMEEAGTPYSDLIRGPSRAQWDSITRLRKDLGQVTGTAEESPETSALKNRLAQESTSFQFDGQTLSDACQYLSARHGINIVVDDQVKADADAQPLPALKITALPLKDALDLLLGSAPGNLTYRVRGNVVFITKPELAREPTIIRIHPVGDLTMKINHFVAPNLILKPAGAEADESNPLFGKMEEGTPTYGSAEDLIALIKDNVGDSPEVWSGEGVAIDAHGDSTILVVAEPALQDGVARFLGDLRKFSGLAVNVEARFLSVSDDFLRAMGVDIRGLGGNKGANATLDDVTNGLEDQSSAGFDNGGVGVPANSSGKPSAGAFFNDLSDGDYRARTEHILEGGLASTLTSMGGAVLQWTLLDDTQVSLIWNATQKSREARVLQAPNLTVYNTQRANITLINQLAFVQDFDVEVAQTAFIADPQIAIIQDGLDLDVKPIISNDRRYVTLQLQPTVATLHRPLQTFTTSLGAFTSPVTLQLPEITIQKAQTTVRVPNGGTLLIGGLKNIAQSDLKSETPLLSKIPIISFFFSSQKSSRDYQNLLVTIRARIVDLSEEEMRWSSR